ncbi:hypothetical protein [Streptomyces sp. SID161]|uniref:hypothetical protein n=1 Tax=Streptomyces sp. SID161 TaxID=2690251 RepID=UPI0013F8611D|nr:hypothetical protein [Streptomyces sp. SID161]MYW20370.1 hypothetical protein [Streptomyces sp. SID2955]MYW46427.1 hypothetical protein [Streptomyces sp. SID161]
MAQSRHPSRIAGLMARTPTPPPALCGFVVLLVLVFSVSYAVGSAAGPVAPGMHGTPDGTGTAGGTSGGGDDGGGGDGPGGGDGGGMGGMAGMHGGGE